MLGCLSKSLVVSINLTIIGFLLTSNSVLGKLNPDLDPLPAAAITTDILFESFIFHVVSKAMQNTIKKSSPEMAKKECNKILKAISSHNS